MTEININDTNLNKLLLKELKELCKKYKILNYSKLKKNNIVKIIQDKLNNNNQEIKKEIILNKNIDNSTYDELKIEYNEILNTDKSTYKSSNDEPTPIECIEEMLNKIPQ